MQRLGRSVYLLPILAVGLWAGCGSTTFVPPPPPELTGAPAAATAVADTFNTPSVDEYVPPQQSGPLAPPPSFDAKGIGLLLWRPLTADRDYLVQVLRWETGKRKLMLRVTKPGPGETITSARLAEAIRKAAGHGLALIVEPRDAPDVCEALRESRSRGSAILMLDHPLSCPGKGVSFPYIAFRGFSERGKQIVGAALDEASLRLPPAPGSIVVLRNRVTDAYSDQRLASLTQALQAKKCPFDLLELDGDKAHAQGLLMDYLKAHPMTVVALTEDDFTLAAAFEARLARKKEGRPELLLAGYASHDLQVDSLVIEEFFIFANRNLDGYGRQAAQSVLDISRGRFVPERIEIDMPFIRLGHADAIAKPAQSLGDENTRVEK